MRKLLLILLILSSLSTASAQESCPLPARMTAGEGGRVLFTDGSPLNIRDASARSGNIVGRLDEGTLFQVVEGGVCADGIHWWRIESGGVAGWAAEGVDGGYFVEPLATAQVEASQALESRLETADFDRALVILEGGALAFADTQLNPTQDISPIITYTILPTIIQYAHDDGFYSIAPGGEPVAITRPDVDAAKLTDWRVSPDQTQAAWLYDVTEIEPTMINECAPESGCIGKVYDLYVADVSGDNPQRIWHGSTGDMTDLRLDRWRLDSEAIYLQTTLVGVASPNYQEQGGFLEIAVDGSTAEITETYFIPVSAYSDDGQWRVEFIRDAGLFVLSSDGETQYSVPQGIIQEQWTFSPDNRYLSWSQVVYGEGIDLAAVEYWTMDLQTGGTHLTWVYRDNLPQSIDTDEIGRGLPFTMAWLADDLLVISQGNRLDVLDVANSGIATLDVPAGRFLAGIIGSYSD